MMKMYILVDFITFLQFFLHTGPYIEEPECFRTEDATAY